jgi:hypothetical protein
MISQYLREQHFLFKHLTTETLKLIVQINLEFKLSEWFLFIDNTEILASVMINLFSGITTYIYFPQRPVLRNICMDIY